MTRAVRLRLIVALLGYALLATPGTAAAAPMRDLDVGFPDGVFSAEPSLSAPWLRRAVDSGADLVRINIGWVAPNSAQRPPGFNARDPADPAYDFRRADAAIVAATGRGLRVLGLFVGAPNWAEGPGRPDDARPGTWRPDPHALEEYGAALAKRYSGAFPDPARPGSMLPRVAAFQVWNEPNLALYLRPIWDGNRPVAATHYRRMLTAFYRGVKSVQSTALVVAAGLAPFGDAPADGFRISPARFVREMLCLRASKGRLMGKRCPSPARFDVLAQHVFPTGSPRRHALNADDVAIPDIGKLSRLLRAAERTGRALPRKRHRIWVTEVGYDSWPPDPRGIPIATHARYLALAFYLLWRDGVDTILWLQIQDSLPIPSFAASTQEGVYFHDGRPKLTQRAFRFPFVGERLDGRTLLVWGRSPVAGTVRIERRVGAGWKLLRTVRVRARGTFLRQIAARGNAKLRARVAGETSLVSGTPRVREPSATPGMRGP